MPLPSLPFHSGGNGAKVSFQSSIIGNFTIYEDQVGIHLLQLYAKPQNVEWFYEVSVIISEVNIVAE